MRTIYNHKSLDQFKAEIRKELKVSTWKARMVEEVIRVNHPKSSATFTVGYSSFQVRFFEWIDGKSEELRIDLQYISEGKAFNFAKFEENTKGLFENLKSYPQDLQRALDNAETIYKEYLEQIERNNAFVEKLSAFGVSHLLSQ